MRCHAILMTAMLIALGVPSVGAGAEGQPNGAGRAQESANAPNALDARAQASLDALIERYWDPQAQMFNNAFPCQSCNGTFHYWWQAHAIDALLDGFERTRDTKYADYVRQLYEGVRRRNGGHLFNDYYDDMEWMGLALMRAHMLTGEPVYREAAERLWSIIRLAWNDHQGGGIPWRSTQPDYKNAPANAPAVILAARLYLVTGDAAHLAWARRIYGWLKERLLDTDRGLVWDGINRTGDGRIDTGWIFTYNQGTFVGAAVALWRATGDEEYLKDARRTAAAALVHLTNAGGILKDEGQGDGGLFKGILVRYLAELDRVLGGGTFIAQAIERNAESAWRARTGALTFGPRWEPPPHTGPVDLSTHLSAVMLFNLNQIAR